jgi:MtN3 and saliva related transmembrane protein
MSIISWAAGGTGVVMGLSGIPQILRIVKNKSGKDVSSKTYIILLLGSVIWLLYSIEIESIPLFVSNLIGILINLIILVLCKRY